MVKLEIVCDNCESHYALVTKEKDEPMWCPFCSQAHTYNEDEVLGESYSEEDE